MNALDHDPGGDRLQRDNGLVICRPISILRDRVSFGRYLLDWLLLPDGTLSEEEELATAVRVAIGTDALADLNEPLPDLDSEDRRGWWGDIDAEEIWGGWPIGSKNWLLMRAKISDELSWEGATLVRAKAYNRAGAAAIHRSPHLLAHRCRGGAQSGARRSTFTSSCTAGPKRLIELRYQYLWDKVTGEPIPVGSKDRICDGILILCPGQRRRSARCARWFVMTSRPRSTARPLSGTMCCASWPTPWPALAHYGVALY